MRAPASFYLAGVSDPFPLILPEGSRQVGKSSIRSGERYFPSAVQLSQPNVISTNRTTRIGHSKQNLQRYR